MVPPGLNGRAINKEISGGENQSGWGNISLNLFSDCIECFYTLPIVCIAHTLVITTIVEAA
jgi:hypothetical protein